MDNEFFTNNSSKNPAIRVRRRGPKPATPEGLEKAALAYLERYATSAENLRRVLMRRVTRSAAIHQTDPEAGVVMVDALIARYRRAGLLNDASYAAGRAASLHRQGKSSLVIRQTLSVKGVDSDTIDTALNALRDEVGDDCDLAAAVNFARRRRIGPWRDSKRATYRERDLAALGRQGFGYDTARRVVEADTPESLLDELQS